MSRAWLLDPIAVAVAVGVASVLSTTSDRRLRRFVHRRQAQTMSFRRYGPDGRAGPRRLGGRVELGRRGADAATRGCPRSRDRESVEDLTIDARYVADFLQTIRGPIVLVGHSYGGAVITNAAAGLAGVKALVYVDVAAPAPGETNGQLSGSRWSSPRAVRRRCTRPSRARHTHRAPTSCTCARTCSSRTSRATCGAPRPSGSGRPSASVHRRVHDPFAKGRLEGDPSWFFVSTGDRIITPASKLAMARRARARVTTFRGGSHLTLISHPEAVAAVIASAICDTTR